MTTCYREPTNGAYFTKSQHTIDCTDPTCRGCVGCRTPHCTARRTCAEHIGGGELTCARCINRTRTDLARIPELAALMPREAIETGVDSEATNLAGPATDPEAWSWRQTYRKTQLATQYGTDYDALEKAIARDIEDDDEHHPYLVLGRWDLAVREDYNHERSTALTVGDAAAYLDRQLGRIAQDDGQDFPQFARELRKCRAHLESVIRDSEGTERGAPCPECGRENAGSVAPRLVREYGHWCERPDCERLHYLDESGDHWQCPRDPGHAWTHSAYLAYVEARQKRSA